MLRANVSPFPMWLQACLLTFNCSPYNAYWFLPKIFAHDWHLRHTWPVTGPLLILTNQCPFADDGQRFGQVIWFRAQLTKPRTTLNCSIVCSLSVFDLLYFLISFNFTGLDLDTTCTCVKMCLTAPEIETLFKFTVHLLYSLVQSADKRISFRMLKGGCASHFHLVTSLSAIIQR